MAVGDFQVWTTGNAWVQDSQGGWIEVTQHSSYVPGHMPSTVQIQTWLDIHDNNPPFSAPWVDPGPTQSEVDDAITSIQEAARKKLDRDKGES